MKETTIQYELKDSNRYLKKISKFYQKYSSTQRKFVNDKSGINISDIYLDQKNITQILIQELDQGHYHISSPEEKKIIMGSKVRFISSYSLLDRLIISILYEVLSEKTLNFLSPCVYSYIPGRSAHQAVHQLTTFLRQVRTVDKQVNVYVLRADITAYSDSIPTDANAIFWAYLNMALENLPTPATRTYIRSLIEDIVRPIMTNDKGLSFQKIVGISTGSALTTLICNLYLLDLDNALVKIPGAFYARYGDDFIFAHTDLEQFKKGDQNITPILERLRLKRNPQKEQRFYLTRAGKSSSHASEFMGCHKIDFLGYAIFADGTITLKQKTINMMLKRIHLRIKNSGKIFPCFDVDKRGAIICEIINQLLDVSNPLVDPTIRRLLTMTDNRNTLRQIDYAFALAIAELLSGKKNVRAFQDISYATIRDRWKLISLCQQKSKLDMHTIF